MKKKYFAAYMLIIVITLLSLPIAFGKWSQSVDISGYIKTAEIELESKEDENFDADQNVDKNTDNTGENDCEESTDLEDYEADKSEQDAVQDIKDDGGIDSGEQTDKLDEGDDADLVPEDELIQKPVMSEDASVPVEENDIDEPESSNSAELQQEMAEDGIPKNSIVNPSDPDGESAEIETDGDEIPASKAVPGDNKSRESQPGAFPVDDENTKTDYSQDQTDEYREYESEAETTPAA